MTNDLMPIIVCFTTTLLVFVYGMSIVRSRQRVRNVADLNVRSAFSRPSRWRMHLAGAIPMPEAEVDALSQDLKRAGFYGGNAVIEFLSTRNILVLGTIFAGGALAVAADPTSSMPRNILIMTAVLTSFAYLIPRNMLRSQANRRLHRILKGLPDALDIVRMCLTGGLPLRDALLRVAREIEIFHPDVSVELEVVRRHAEADTMAKALKEFSKRMNAPDVNALANLVTQSEKTGTHVAAAVTEFSDGIRRQFLQRAEERANKTSVKLLFPVVLCLAPPVFILLIGPPVLQLRNFVRDAHKPGGVLEIPRQVPTTSNQP
jgi:tight adherence protein C